PQRSEDPMRITPLLFVPLSLFGCATITPMSGDYDVSPFQAVSNSCGTELDVDEDGSEMSVGVDAPTETVAIELGDGMAFECDLHDDEFDCNDLTVMSSDDRADIVITYGWHLAGAFASEVSIDPLTFTFSATCAGDDCKSLVEQSDMTLPCAVVFQSDAELQ
ncbi:MAG: hypothetical protein AB8H79_06850, partial [Myxococcota bacterium]